MNRLKHVAHRVFTICAASVFSSYVLAEATVTLLPEECILDASVTDMYVFNTLFADFTDCLQVCESTITQGTIDIQATSSGGVDDPFGSYASLLAVFSGNGFGPAPLATLTIDSEYAEPPSSLNGTLAAEDIGYATTLDFSVCGFTGYRRYVVAKSDNSIDCTFDPLSNGADLQEDNGVLYLSPGVYRYTLNQQTAAFIQSWTLEIYDDVCVPCGDASDCQSTQFVFDTSTFTVGASDEISGNAESDSNLGLNDPFLITSTGGFLCDANASMIDIRATSSGGVDDPFDFQSNTIDPSNPIASGFLLQAGVYEHDGIFSADTIDVVIAAELHLERPGEGSSGSYRTEVVFKLDGFEGMLPYEILSDRSAPGDAELTLVPCTTSGGELVDGAIGPGCYTVVIEKSGAAGSGVDVDFEQSWTIVISLPPMTTVVESEPNDTQEDRNIIPLPEDETDLFISGKLIPEEIPDCQPDTYLVLFDKQDNRVGFNDNSDCAGNGWGSGILGATLANGMIIDNNDGSRSLRAGVTGRLDGLDQVFNGLFMNAPHGQLGEWELAVTFYEGAGPPPAQVTIGGVLVDNPVRYRDGFVTGAEAFRVNYTFGPEITSVDLCVDNTVGMAEVCNDVDFFELEGLVPLCDYCIEQVGGLDERCLPTDTLLGWFDKLGTLITKSETGGAAMEWPKLNAVADINGKITFAITGSDDCDFDGFDDESMEAPGRALSECPEVPVGHGVCGCYTLHVYPAESHGDPGGGESGEEKAMLTAMHHGDINMDGITDSADLGILIGQFGWVAD